LRSLAAASVACFAVEYLGLFAGASIFMRGHTCLYILLHFAGAVLTGLFYTQVMTPAESALWLAEASGARRAGLGHCMHA
jgi:hypothetical protein